MAFLDWNEKFSVGIPQFDQEHKSLLFMINTLHQAIINGNDQAVLPVLLEELSFYIKNHLSNEEALMEKHQFPQFVAHKKQHDYFIAKINQYQLLHKKNALRAEQLLQILDTWFVYHICTIDQQYEAFFKDIVDK